MEGKNKKHLGKQHDVRMDSGGRRRPDWPLLD
jgi:hypothetical protein